MSETISEEMIAALLAQVEAKKKELRKNPKAYHAAYVKNWRNRKKAEMMADPDYIAEQARLQAIKDDKKAKNEKLIKERTERREARQKRKDEALAAAKKKQEEYKEFVESCYITSKISEEDKKKIHSIYLNPRYNNDILTHYMVVFNYFVDKKFTTIKKPTNVEINNVVEPINQAKIILINFLVSIKTEETTKIVSKVEENEFEIDEEFDFDELDLG